MGTKALEVRDKAQRLITDMQSQVRNLPRGGATTIQAWIDGLQPATRRNMIALLVYIAHEAANLKDADIGE